VPKRLTLTPKEWDCVAHMSRGASQRETAEALGITPQTVKNHVGSAMRKYEAQNVRELAYFLGWVKIGPRPDK